MQVTETSAEGLKRAYTIKVDAADLDSKLTEKLTALAARARLPGFRPGKVPVSYLRRLHGDALMGEVLEETVNQSSQAALEENSIRPAMQPDIKIKDDFEPGNDLEFDLSVEVLPDFEPTDFSKISLEREVAPVEDAEVDEALQRLADQQKAYDAKAKTYKAKDGDMVVIDFVGKIDGEAFEGGAAEDFELVLGSGSFIEGFEDQLLGVKAEEEKDVTVSFPEDYRAEDLAGKDAVFSVTVKEVRAPVDVAIDDELATKVGLENLDDLKTRLREGIQRDHDQISRIKLKRALLDQLADLHDFDVPEGMVELEFNQIWQDLEQSLEQEGKTLEEADKPEDELRAEYRDIAIRRVRLGLVLSRVGEDNEISVGAEELNQAMMREAQRFPGQERQIFEFYQKNPQAMQQLRAPLFEDKVIDFVVEMAKVTEKTVDRDTLMRDPDEEEDASEKTAAKKAAPKKAAAKKAPAKKAAAKKTTASSKDD